MPTCERATQRRHDSRPLRGPLSSDNEFERGEPELCALRHALRYEVRSRCERPYDKGETDRAKSPAVSARSEVQMMEGSCAVAMRVASCNNISRIQRLSGSLL